ncbi:type IV secretory system conjugative DNA transfer family protein [Roseobacter sp. HKCCD9010]|uniref:type IV secretory system conjugative DNA transfer family protein n=1 Tax=unclassified Roseobacter TaxID=196798 RepID=UPI001493214A|nr:MULTISPECIES: type IV secretory system conjugative DNA transfer family protein [unclassified Roseobacter]MBF9051900.1 type IV secretory system conjugative DNA transfer family protein [Rhodobacterales bacterium HKCCD4356]NNV13893.1 type IV secretory system conjugative DNA transfer family protein [Roseobacter sp. HKCCD7357]NNV18065.1 type IV secretory system conjugative DNA transfer family protein [Roseobacter sp. HKCCD8768]NNV27525.1 type IV secretory system conjugative DNA transfer family pr
MIDTRSSLRAFARFLAWFSAVALITAIGFLALRQLWLGQVINRDHFDPWLIAVCLLPAAAAHVAAYTMDERGPHMWILWVPGLVLYAVRPWRTEDGWQALWVFDDAVDWIRSLVFDYHYTSDFTFNAATGFLIMVLAACFVAARFTMAVFKWFERAGRGMIGADTRGTRDRPGLTKAEWASQRDVRKRFHHPGGIVIGEHTDPLRDSPNFDPNVARSWGRQGKGHLITLDPAVGNGHVIVFAASGGYKTAGLVIPNILNYAGPLVVFDPKGDLYARTRHERARMGYKSVLIDADSGFDPFKMIAPLAPLAPSVYLRMAKTLMPLGQWRSDNSEYFHEMAVNLFAALTAHFVEERSPNVAMEISRFINRSRDTVISEAIEYASKHDMAFVRDELLGMAALEERTWPGVIKGMSNKLALFRFPDVAQFGHSTKSPVEHLSALDPDTDIYINLPASAAMDFSSFPRLLLGGMMVVAELLEQPDRPRARRLFLIDEARVLEGMTELLHIRDAGRSIGMHLMLIYQSLGQLEKAWGGPAGADAWLDSCEARIISALGSRRNASDLSEMLGRHTLRIVTADASSSRDLWSPMRGSTSESEREQLREVPLMTAAEIGQLPAHGQVIMTRRSAPILASKAVYFTRRDMADRVQTPEAVADELAAVKRRSKVLKKISIEQVEPQEAGRRRTDRPNTKGRGQDTGAPGGDPRQGDPDGAQASKASGNKTLRFVSTRSNREDRETEAATKVARATGAGGPEERDREKTGKRPNEPPDVQAKNRVPQSTKEIQQADLFDAAQNKPEISVASWSDADDQELRVHVENAESTAAIAALMGRQPEEIDERLAMLFGPKPGSQDTDGSADDPTDPEPHLPL